MEDTKRLLTSAIFDKLRAKLPVSEDELQVLQKHVDELEQKLAPSDTHHHGTQHDTHSHLE